MPGPVPLRDEDRIRRNAPDFPIETIEASGDVPVPSLELPFGAAPMVVDFYESLQRSAYTKYYEPSDWEMARLACFLMNTIVTSPKPSSEMVKALQTLLSNLLVTEGDRRRLRIEITRNVKENAEKDELADVMEMFQKRMEQKMRAQ